MVRPVGAAVLTAVLVGLGCASPVFEWGRDPRAATSSVADVQAEISALAEAHEERAALRTSLGCCARRDRGPRGAATEGGLLP